ncbi:membrane protein [Pseudoalteromonas luteoviolacea]|nr:membrane protein [Pseudoalteromonas luteoviolacea]
MSIRQTTPAKIKLASFAGLNYDENWTVKLSPKLTYHTIDLKTNLKNAKTIKKVRIDIGGTDVFTITGERLRQLNAIYQDFTQDGRFVLDMSNFRYRTPAGIYQTQLVTNITDDVTLTVEFGARGTGDPEKLEMSGVAYATDTDAVGRAFVPTKKEFTQMTASAGEHSWLFPNGAPNKFIQRMIFDENEVKISKITVKRGGNTIHVFERDDLDFDLQRYAGAKLLPGICVLDFTAFGFGANGATPSVGLEFVLDVDGKGSIKTYVEGYDQLKALRLPTAA